MSNSKLICFTKISPNKTSPRKNKIDTITIHCMAGDCSVETCGNIFAAPSRKASSNYGIDSKGRIGMYVEEKDRSWCSSSGANDHRAITIEVANDGGADTGWHVSDKAMAALIDLCVDICKRNGIKKLLWKADKSLIGQVDKQNMTVHRWFAAKSCPGDYLFGKHAEIAEKVNARLGSTTTANKTASSVAKLESAKDYDKKFARSFTVLTDSLNMRYGAGVDKKILAALKKGASFRCYGYFTETKDGTIWLFGVSGGKMGFCSKKYLK